MVLRRASRWAVVRVRLRGEGGNSISPVGFVGGGG